MTRRKSRPLLPHEVFSFHSSQEHSDNANSSSFSAQGGSQQQLASSQSSMINTQSTANGVHIKLPGTVSADAISSNIRQHTASMPSSNTMTQHPRNCSTDPAHCTNSSKLEQKAEGNQARVTDLIRSLSQTAPIKRRPGYLSNRRSASFVIHDEHHDTLQQSRTSTIGKTCPEDRSATSSQPLKRTPSNVRLSLSLDGKAEVTTGTGKTPSPPRSQPMPLINSAPRPHTGLQRSYSAIEPINKSFQEPFSAPYSRHAVAGRSRDARTWEFYCDSDVRNALTEQAELQESGSATAVISLIRSHSNKAKAMVPNLNKRLAQPQKSDSPKRLKADGSKTGKPKLGRASSSVARLQTDDGHPQKQKPRKDGHKHSKSNSQSVIFQDYEGDSDKENWAPGTQTSNPPRRRPAKSRQAARILEESLRVPSQSSSLDALMSRANNASRRLSGKGSSGEGKENGHFEVDDEVAAFMGESGPRGVEDLDCVQNLLSLSQAAWR